MTRNPIPDPAAVPVRRGAPAAVPGGCEGEPGPPTAPEDGGPGTTTSRQAVSPDTPMPGGRPGPETRRPGPAAVRAGDQTPAGGASPAAEHSTDASPDRTKGYSGEEFRKKARAVLSGQAKEQRRRATRYVPRSRKGVQAATGPGMVRRMPPPPTPGGDAA